MNPPLLRHVTALALGAWLTLLPYTATAEEVETVELSPGWSYRVVAEDLPRVDNVVRGPGGYLYVTLELGKPNGKLVRIDDPGALVVVDGLDHPDGLFASGGLLYITEETSEGRVLAVDVEAATMTTVATLNHPEGIAMLPNGEMIIAEDRSLGGRVVRLAEDGTVHPFMDQLVRPEGLTVGPDGAVFVAETAKGRIVGFRDGRMWEVAGGLAQPDQVVWGPDGTLWVTEDQNPGRLLRIARDGLVVVARGLHSPQGIHFAGGEVLVAEQGRGRLLALRWKAPKTND